MDSADKESFEDYVVDVAKKSIFNELIGKLPEIHQLVLTLYFCHGFSMEKVAQILGISKGNAAKIHNQAVKEIRALESQGFTLTPEV